MTVSIITIIDMTHNKIRMEHKITIIQVRIQILIVIHKMTKLIMANTKLRDLTIQVLKAISLH